MGCVFIEELAMVLQSVSATDNRRSSFYYVGVVDFLWKEVMKHAT